MLNVNLTKRRINSLVNYLKEYKSGIFLPYINGTSLNGGKIIFEEVPFGEFVANKLTSDNPHDQKNSIFSRSAAIERKIEILSVSYLVEELDNKKDETIFPLSPEKQLLDGGKIKSGDVIVRKFNVTNTSNSVIEFDQTNIPCDCNSAKIEKLILKPGESTFVEMKFDSKGYSGKIVKSIYLKVKNQIGDLRLILTAEVTP